MGSCVSQPEVNTAASNAVKRDPKNKTKKHIGSSHWFFTGHNHGLGGIEGGGGNVGGCDAGAASGGGGGGCGGGGGGCGGGGGGCGGGGC